MCSNLRIKNFVVVIFHCGCANSPPPPPQPIHDDGWIDRSLAYFVYFTKNIFFLLQGISSFDQLTLVFAAYTHEILFFKMLECTVYERMTARSDFVLFLFTFGRGCGCPSDHLHWVCSQGSQTPNCCGRSELLQSGQGSIHGRNQVTDRHKRRFFDSFEYCKLFPVTVLVSSENGCLGTLGYEGGMGDGGNVKNLQLKLYRLEKFVGLWKACY